MEQRGLWFRRGKPGRVGAGADVDDPRRHRDHAGSRAHARGDGGNGDDAAQAVGRALPARARAVGSASRRGLARHALRRLAATDARVHRDRTYDPQARRTGGVRGRALSAALRRSRRQRPRQAAEEHDPRRSGDADLHRGDHARGAPTRRRARRRGIPDLHRSRPARRSHRVARARLRRRRARRRGVRCGALRLGQQGRRHRRMPPAGQARPRAVHRRHGRPVEELLQRLRQAPRLRRGCGGHPEPVSRRSAHRRGGGGARRPRRRHVARRTEGAHRRAARGVEGCRRAWRSRQHAAPRRLARGGAR